MDDIKIEDVSHETCHQCIANHVERHIQTALKLTNICKWMDSHDKEVDTMKDKLEKRFDKWESKQTGIFVSVILLLVAALFNMGLHFMR